MTLADAIACLIATQSKEGQEAAALERVIALGVVQTELTALADQLDQIDPQRKRLNEQQQPSIADLSDAALRSPDNLPWMIASVRAWIALRT